MRAFSPERQQVRGDRIRHVDLVAHGQLLGGRHVDQEDAGGAIGIGPAIGEVRLGGQDRSMVPTLNFAPRPWRTCGQRKLMVPTPNSSRTRPTPAASMRRRNRRRLISPAGGVVATTPICGAADRRVATLGREAGAAGLGIAAARRVGVAAGQTRGSAMRLRLRRPGWAGRASPIRGRPGAAAAHRHIARASASGSRRRAGAAGGASASCPASIRLPQPGTPDAHEARHLLQALRQGREPAGR